MKLPNWFKILWWVALLVLLSIAVYSRYPKYIEGNVTYLDALVLLLWIALALVPIFQEVKLWGLNLKQSVPPVNQQEVKIPDTFEDSFGKYNEAADELLKKIDKPAIVKRESELMAEMKNLLPTKATERNKLLLRFLATMSLNITLERLFPIIYESQISLLMYLNVKSENEVMINEIRNIYEEAKTKFPALYNTYSFENWLGFLQSQNLIVFGPEKIRLTDTGAWFLEYFGSERIKVKKGFY